MAPRSPHHARAPRSRRQASARQGRGGALRRRHRAGGDRRHRAAADGAVARRAAAHRGAVRRARHVYETDEEGWAWGQLKSDGYVGLLPAAALLAPGAPPTHKVAALRTLVFPGPSIKLPPTDALPLGAQVAVAREQDSFAVTAAGGFMCRSVIWRRSPRPRAISSRWPSDSSACPISGAASRASGIDCSGLVQVALTACGIKCPRDSDMQESALGKPASLAGLQARRSHFLEGPRRHRARPQQHDPRQRLPHGGGGRARGRRVGADRRRRQPGHQRAAAEMKGRALLLLCALLAAGSARADDYPSKSIRLIVPFAAGGAVGAVARVLSTPLTREPRPARRDRQPRRRRRHHRHGRGRQGRRPTATRCCWRTAA